MYTCIYVYIYIYIYVYKENARNAKTANGETENGRSGRDNRDILYHTVSFQNFMFVFAA